MNNSCELCINFSPPRGRELFPTCLRRLFTDSESKEVRPAAVERETDCRGKYFIDAAIVAMMD